MAWREPNGVLRERQRNHGCGHFLPPPILLLVPPPCEARNYPVDTRTSQVWPGATSWPPRRLPPAAGARLAVLAGW